MSAKKYKKVLNFYLNLIILSSFLFSQLSLAEIFLYQNNSNNNSSDIYHNIINIAQAGTSDSWYNSSYSYRKEITIDHTKVSNTDQSNFPMLISLTDTSLKTVLNGGKVQNNNGYDIIFTNQTGDIKLDHEIESYDPENGTIVMWVKIPTLSASTDTIIYIYYGNKNITNSQENITGVWDDGGSNNFKMVQHMNQDPSGTAPQMIDSVVGIADGTSYGTMLLENLVAGKINKNLNFDGIDDYLRMPDETVGSIQTVSTWLRVDPTNEGAAVSFNGSGLVGYFAYTHYITSTAFKFQICAGGAGNTLWSIPHGVDIMQWHLWTYERNDTAITLYIDGVYAGNLTISSSCGSTVLNGIGSRAYAGPTYKYFKGSIDEVRISSTARSSDWIATEYNNQSSPSTFLSLSSEEEYMDHFIISGSLTQTAGNTQTLTITAINMFGNTNTAYNGDKDITISGANTIDSNLPTFTDKNGTEIPFNSSGTITFTNGIATTDITLYQAESAEIEVSDGTYSTNDNIAYDLNIEVSPNIFNNFTVNTPASITSETPFNLSLTAKDIYTNTTTNVSNSTILSISQGTMDISSIPNTQFTDNGIYTTNLTISEIYQDQSIILTITNGSIIKTINLQVTGVSHTSVFIPPAKPNLSNLTITNNNGHIDISNLPSNITQIAISSNPEFTDSSWENITDINNILSKYQSNIIYIKFRTNQGATSDIQTYTNNNSIVLNEGDIVKTESSFDVYIIKYNNNKQYKRLILSPQVFNSYQHLKWENIKTISQEQINQYQTSDLVKVQNDNNIYQLIPNGDQGTKRIVATYNNGILNRIDNNTTIDVDSIYEINEVDRESYILVR